ncbi:hypothetical protein PBAL39_10845 [Pedobacter sp. BAL39]|nr:hypothetical protein PBAL39_10845 [Pedobacter sp. BAL39]
MISLTSCLKNSSVDEQPPYVSVINTSPTLGTVNIYVDGTVLNSGAVPFGGALAYSQVTAGDHTFKFTTASGTESLLTKAVSLSADKIYSFYLTGKEEQMDGLLVEDDLSVSSTDKAFVRFINLSPDAPALDLSTADGVMLFSAKAYRESTAFNAINPATYTLVIKDASTAVQYAAINAIAFTAGKYYTIISRGMLVPGSIDQPFSSQIIINL